MNRALRSLRALRTAPDLRSCRPLLWLVLGVVAAACTPSTGQVEQGIERELPRLIGPADRYEVDIQGLRARSGEASRVLAVGEGVRRPDAPAVERLEVELHDLRYDRRRKRVERVDSARATATITSDALASFLQEQAGVESASVTLRQPDQALVQVRPALGGLALPPGVTVDVTGRLVGEGSEIRFEVSEVRAGGLRLGDAMAQRISGLANPLIDLSELPLPVRITGVRVEDGALRVEAVGDAVGLGR